ncbi:MAG: hypothetical protein WC917_00605 [Bacilli bacterium]
MNNSPNKLDFDTDARALEFNAFDFDTMKYKFTDDYYARRRYELEDSAHHHNWSQLVHALLDNKYPKDPKRCFIKFSRKFGLMKKITKEERRLKEWAEESAKEGIRLTNIYKQLIYGEIPEEYKK